MGPHCAFRVKPIYSGMRTRPDYRTQILEQLRLHGPMSFRQLRLFIRLAPAHVPADKDDLDYDLRCLRQEGIIRTIPGRLWVIGA